MSAPSTARISLRLRDLNQLFNSMDPSPFLDRDLDHDAEEFIVSWARESHGSSAFELVIHLGTLPDPRRAAETEDAVRHYFAARAELKRRELRHLLRRGHTSLAVGLSFLTLCLSFGGVANRLFAPSAAEVVREGLIIVGWVAMWRPLETYLYDWWPLREEWSGLNRLARLRVRLILPPVSRSVDKPDSPSTAQTDEEGALLPPT